MPCRLWPSSREAKRHEATHLVTRNLEWRKSLLLPSKQLPIQRRSDTVFESRQCEETHQTDTFWVYHRHNHEKLQHIIYYCNKDNKKQQDFRKNGTIGTILRLLSSWRQASRAPIPWIEIQIGLTWESSSMSLSRLSIRRFKEGFLSELVLATN